ncbi:BcII family subclass B1 metallo-beta-lactamase [Ravibacter arvi]|uniref:beta-lactamase n=1 Tax=Ravibacter arvi TaxID=2051041 RepID=A0ABP8LLW8_9BACT
MRLLAKTCFLVIILGLKAYAGGDKPEVAYRTETLVITRLAENVYEHTSFLNTRTFGKVPCNGMVITAGKEAVVFDTPADDPTSAELIAWISSDVPRIIKAVVATHFHEDCVGGLREFRKHSIPSHASFGTIKLTKAAGFPVPDKGFREALALGVGDKKVEVRFFGEGHTRDNVVGYYPDEKVLFGGCLIKELNAGKGNLADANVKAWAETVRKVKAAYPDVKVVIPGHGKTGDKSLLDYTIGLFSGE